MEVVNFWRMNLSYLEMIYACESKLEIYTQQKSKNVNSATAHFSELFMLFQLFGLTIIEVVEPL